MYPFCWCRNVPNRIKYIGWSKGNTVNFIVATTLARHKLRTLGFRLKPFTFGAYSLVQQVKRYNPCYLIGSFEGGEIDALLEMNVKATIIGKIYDAKYNIDRKRKIGSIIIYPVPKTGKLGGLEYLAVLASYFNISSGEVRFFEVMLSRKDVLAKVLTVTDAWIPAYELFTTFEVIDDPTPDSVGRVIEYLKKSYNYDGTHKMLLEELQHNVVLDRGSVVAIDLGKNDPKRYMIIAKELYQNKRAIILASTVPNTNTYKLLVICNRKCDSSAKKIIAEALRAECRGGSKRFTVRVQASTDLRRVLEAIAAIIESTAT